MSTEDRHKSPTAAGPDPLTIGDGHALAPSLETLAWLVVLLAVFVPLSVRALQRA